MTKRILKRAANAAVAVTIAAAVVACAPEAPDPEPSFLTFASEEEAYAAAEEVYRAYSEAVAKYHADHTDTSSLEYVSGLAHSAEVSSRNDESDDDYQASGSIVNVSFTGVDATVGESMARVVAEVCEDVSGFRLFDADGNDVTSPDRPDIVGYTLIFTAERDRLKISNTEYLDPEKCAQ